MLSWDESSQPALPRAMPNFPLSGAPADRFADLSTLPSSAPLASGPQADAPIKRRVNAADKRIINGKTDVNQ
ncbi:MAG: ribonucleotide-diphosphate reductase subunit beta, partial [Betaproteobacteria bacterium]|nr:ribonucleotide-diphosphate reductase subunit beta [Betaproteobacteria bacterium]